MGNSPAISLFHRGPAGESGGIGHNGTQHVLRFPCWGTLKEVKQAREKENPHPLRYTRDSATRAPKKTRKEYLKTALISNQPYPFRFHLSRGRVNVIFVSNVRTIQPLVPLPEPLISFSSYTPVIGTMSSVIEKLPFWSCVPLS